MAEDGGKKEDQFGFTPEGEALGYISLDQARVLAMRTARETPGAYGRRFRDVPMAFEIVAEHETEDHYVVTLSFRPQGRFTGAPGQEQFFIEKEGAVAHRQVLALPAPAGGRRFPVVPVAVGLAAAAIAAVVGVVLLGGGGSGSGDGDGTPMPAIAVAPTATQVPASPTAVPLALVATPVPTPEPTPTPRPEPKGTLTAAQTAAPAPTATPVSTLAPSSRLIGTPNTSSNLGKFYQGRTLHLNVVAIERLPELRYATIDPEQVVRRWRLVPSSKNLELVMLRLKVENHTAISVVLDIDQQAAQLRDVLRETYFPIDLPGRVFQDLRGQAAADVHMKHGQCFDPNQMYITPGTTVNWVNEGSVDHVITLGPNKVTLMPGGSYSYVFGRAGTWDYVCSTQYQPVGQEARIVVEEAGSQPLTKERPVVFVYGPFEMAKGMGVDGWMVFEAPKGAEFRDFRWLAGDSITIGLR